MSEIKKTKFISEIAEELNINPAQIKKILEMVQHTIEDEIVKNGVFKFFDIGTFKVVELKATTKTFPDGRNIKVPARKKIKFVLSNKMKKLAKQITSFD